MRLAIKNDLALIQGPPGTGKTYIGVQIVRLLIKYRSYWNKVGPILLVTYSNHALL
jgi:superfamily II DNA or RNA helicase